MFQITRRIILSVRTNRHGRRFLVLCGDSIERAITKSLFSFHLYILIRNQIVHMMSTYASILLFLIYYPCKKDSDNVYAFHCHERERERGLGPDSLL